MIDDYRTITVRIVTALIAGALIGIERSFHGRPAGFRTHGLVCVASSLLMLLPGFPSHWVPMGSGDIFRTDPTRLAQGIMTGIGFLGAGIIYKEGFSVHGLTTAASIWITAAIGILVGVGFFFPAVLTAGLTLGVLSVFRRVEERMPAQSYAYHHVRFARADTMPEDELRSLLTEHGFAVANLSYRTTNEGRTFEYRMTIRTTDSKNIARLADTLRGLDKVQEFRLSPTRE